MTTTWPPRWPPATRRWPLGPTVGLRQSLVGCSCPLLSRGEAPGTLEEGCLRKPTRGLEPRTPSLRAAAAVRGALRLLYAMRVAIGDHRVPRSERLPLSMGVVLPPRCHLTRAGTGLEASNDGRKKEGTWGRAPHVHLTTWGVWAGRVHLPDRLQEPLVLDDPLGALAAGAPVVGGRRHVQDLADRLDGEAPRCSSM